MELFERESVIRHLPMDQCVALMREVMEEYAKGSYTQYLRTASRLPNGNIVAFMPGWLGEDYFGVKLITVFHDNYKIGLSSHQGTVVLFDSKNGSQLFMADADAITMIRTAAVSAVGTDLLARKDASRLAILGCGAQGRSHLEAMAVVRNLTDIAVWDIDGEIANRFSREMADKAPCPIRVCSTAKEAVENADIICTVTSSKEPVLEAEWVKAGAHINAVGASSKDRRELGSTLVAKCRLYGDAVESVVNESGDYLVPLREGLITEDHLLGIIGQILTGEIEGRQSDTEITCFDALGLAIEDVACAKFLYEHCGK